jgi:GTPase SAR1 family protein
MKIKEIQNNIVIKSPKLSTSNRPDNLSEFLNYVGLQLIIGLSGSGKTSLIYNLLNGTNQNNLYNNVFHSIYYITPSSTIDLNIDPEKMIILDDDDNISNILEEIIDNEKDKGTDEEAHHIAILMDDCVNYLSTQKNSMKIFRKLVMNGRHILGTNSSVATFLVSQKVRSIPLVIRSQANAIYFFNSTKAEKAVIQEEFMPLDKSPSQKILDYIFDVPYNFLFINLQLPIKQRIFKNFNQMIFE